MKSALNFKVIKDEKIYDMHDEGIWVESFHIHSPNISLKTISVPGMDKVYLEKSEMKIRDVSLRLTVHTKSIKELDDKKHFIYDLFYSQKEFLIIRDFKNLTINVIQEGSYDLNNITYADGEFDVSLKMLDPFLYGPEKTLSFPTDMVVVENQGTAETDPVFELTATKKTTFAMISNQEDEYMLIGTPADVDEEVVDEKVLLFEERGENLSSWTSSGTQVDGGSVAGSMTTDGTGIVQNGYGTGSAWHGPALLKEIPPTEDFEVEMRMRAESTNPTQTYRIEFYLYDENMNVLGKMGIMDSTQSQMRYVAEGRVGEFEGKGNNYLIYSKNYLRQRPHFHGLVRMKRIGKQFEFYVARLGVIGDFTHWDTFTQKFNDLNNKYQGKLKYVQIHIGKYGNTPGASIPRINSIRIYAHNKLTVDQTPYILDIGDTLTFDHKENDILINGEPRNDLKNFGGSFFKLKKGNNILTVTPEDSFNTKVIFKDRYL